MPKMKTKPVLSKEDHSSVTEKGKHKLSLESLNSHLEAITKKVDANTTAVNNILVKHTKGLNESKTSRIRK